MNGTTAIVCYTANKKIVFFLYVIVLKFVCVHEVCCTHGLTRVSLNDTSYVFINKQILHKKCTFTIMWFFTICEKNKSVTRDHPREREIIHMCLSWRYLLHLIDWACWVFKWLISLILNRINLFKFNHSIPQCFDSRPIPILNILCFL